MQIADIYKDFDHARQSPPLDLAEAIEIFDILANAPDIAFGFGETGCIARARLMCEKLEAKGLTPEKAWAFEGDDPDKDYLHVTLPDGKEYKWSMHTAIALPVRLPGGNIEKMVFDPSLFNGPASLQEWGGVMQARPDKLEIVPLYHCPSKRNTRQDDHRYWTQEAPHHIHAHEVMKEHLEKQDKGQRHVFASKTRVLYEQLENTTEKQDLRIVPCRL